MHGGQAATLVANNGTNRETKSSGLMIGSCPGLEFTFMFIVRHVARPLWLIHYFGLARSFGRFGFSLLSARAAGASDAWLPQVFWQPAFL